MESVAKTLGIESISRNGGAYSIRLYTNEVHFQGVYSPGIAVKIVTAGFDNLKQQPISGNGYVEFDFTINGIEIHITLT